MPENGWMRVWLIMPAPREAVDMDCIWSTNFFQSQWKSWLLTGLNYLFHGRATNQSKWLNSTPLKMSKVFCQAESLFISYRLPASAFTLIMAQTRSIHREYHLQRNKDKWCSSPNRTLCHQKHILQSSWFYSFQFSCYLLKIKVRWATEFAVEVEIFLCFV